MTTWVDITYGRASTATPPLFPRRRYPCVPERCTAKAPFPVPVLLAAEPVPLARPVEALERPAQLARLFGAPRERRALRAGVERKDAA